MTDPGARPGGSAPVLLTSLSSAVLLDGSGDLTLPRETRGSPLDWGGVYARLVRLCGPWQLHVTVDGVEYGLGDTRVEAGIEGARWWSHHRLGRVQVDQDVAPTADPAGAVRRLRFTLLQGPGTRLRVVSRLPPHLLPVLVEGVVPTVFRLETHREHLRVRQHGFAFAFRASILPSQLYVNRGSWRGGRYEGRVDELATEHEVELGTDGPTELTFQLSGGFERDLKEPEAADAGIPDPEAAGRAEAERVAAWVARTPEMSFPDAPFLEDAYRAARAALRRLYSEPGDGLTGLVAGYPWYSAIWCRDLAWMLPSVLWLGDWEWAERSIASVLRFQSQTAVPILGGEPGELPMQIAPGPLFLYGTSDTTLYYPGLVRRLVRHAGRSDRGSSWTPAVRRMIQWGEARTDPATGLLRNGGEAEAISAATGSLARVRYGIDSPDTTIWDSADRRDHAIDVQVLWWEALGAGADLLTDGPDDPVRSRCRRTAEVLADSVRTRYGWTEEGYLFDSLRAGAPIRKLRPNALRAVSAGVLPPEVARSVVRRAAKPDLTTDWGVRTLSSQDPTYDPVAYHEGEVWPIATAWAADAALAVGEVDLGLRYLGTIADRIRAEGGFANECYRGDRAEAFDSCFLLGFSVAPFLSVLFERLWGLDIDSSVPRLRAAPSFPSGWRSASIDRLRVGPGEVRLDWRPGGLRAQWSGPGSLEVRAVSESVQLAALEARELPLPLPPAPPEPRPPVS